MIDPSKLDHFSRAFYAELRRAFPDLASRAALDIDPRRRPGSLVVEFAPNAARPESVFLISTDNDEVTVGFDQYHQHFEWPSKYPDWQIDPIGFIDALMREQVVVEIREQSGKWAGSTVLEADRKPDLSGLQGDQALTIRSWSGRLDRTYARDNGIE